MPKALRNSSNDMGYMNMEWILPTPKVGISLRANSSSEPAAITCSSGMSSQKNRRDEMASWHICISSKNSNVFPGTIGLPVIDLIISTICFASLSPWNISRYAGLRSKFISTKLSNCLAKWWTEEDLPTCLAPRSKRGL